MPGYLIDLTIVFLYLVGILAFGLWMGRRTRSDREGYFLGGRRFGWLLIGASLFAANISSVQFVGQSGLAYQIGISAANPQIIGGIMLGVSAVFFIPVYLRTRIFTIPTFLEQRFNRKCKIVYSLTAITMGLFGIPVMLYAGCLVVIQLAGLDERYLLPCAAVMGLAVGLYAIVGGLTSIVYTELVHAVVLLLGGVLVLSFGLIRAGAGVFSGGVPNEHLRMIQPFDHPEMPITGVVTGLAFASLFWATTNQDILQRVLGARDLRHAQLGMLLGAFLKIIAIFVLVFPGLIASQVVPGINPDRAFPALVQTLLPVGLSGVVLAGLMAALMSSMDASLISVSTLFTIDVYPLVDRQVNERRALIVGRLVAGIVLAWAILLTPLIPRLGLIYPLIMKAGAYLLASVGVCYVLGRFSRRVNAFGALTTLVVGLVTGVLLVAITSVPVLKRFSPGWLLTTNFFHVSGGLVVLYSLVLMLASRLRPAPSEEELAFLRPPSTASAEMENVAHPPAILRRFGFWAAVYAACVAGVYLLF